MPESLKELPVVNDEIVRAEHISMALTANTLIFDDGATQTFTLDGETTYIDLGQPSHGAWWALGDGQFVSFWPPDYQATYHLRWLVEDGTIAGVTFTELESETRFTGRYL